MSIIDRFRAAVGGFFSFNNLEQSGAKLLFGSLPSAAGVRVDTHNAQTLSAVWACVSILSNGLSQLPIGLYKREGDNITPVTDHPVSDLFTLGFNADLSAFMGMYAGQSQISLRGNSYLEIERSGDGTPSALHLLETDATWPVIDETLPRLIVDHYQTTFNGTTRQLIPEDVVHVRGHAERGVFGRSPITAAREAIGLALAQEKFGAKFFGNDAKSGGYFIQPAVTNVRSAKQQADSIVNEQGGPERSHIPKVLDPGVKFIPTMISPEDSQFLGSRAFQIGEIGRFFDVPLIFLDSSAAVGWGTGIEQTFIQFVQRTMVPLARRWEDEFTRKLLTPRERRAGMYVRINVEGLLRGDMAATVAFYTGLVGHDIVEPNEARVALNMNPIPGLNERAAQNRSKASTPQPKKENDDA